MLHLLQHQSALVVSHATANLIQPSAPSFLCLHLGKVVVIEGEVSHDGLFVWTRDHEVWKSNTYYYSLYCSYSEKGLAFWSNYCHQL